MIVKNPVMFLQRTIKAIKLAKNPWSIDDAVIVVGGCDCQCGKRALDYGTRYMTYRDLWNICKVFGYRNGYQIARIPIVKRVEVPNNIEMTFYSKLDGGGLIDAILGGKIQAENF